MAAPSDHRRGTGCGVADFVEALRSDAELGEALVHRERLPARPPRPAALPEAFARLAPVLERRGIDSLYTHQERALSRLEAGRDVVVATSTASGKTLVYALATLRRLLEDPGSRALYLFPLKALSQDQRRGLESDIDSMGRPDLRVAVYDGDTPPARRRALRDDPPSVLITTPDMLHAGLLPHHARWQAFFERLDLVVIDELHTYRGIFGAHVAQVMRRLQRVARHHGSAPRIVAASATLANPGELAHALTGRPFAVIEEDGAPRSARDVVLFRPRGSPYTLAARLFRAALERDLRTIAFTKSRIVTELLHRWIVEAQPELAPRISSYRAGFLPAERRDIEGRLFDGTLRGVIATSALELGIDVGGLDVCILVGYPGSQVATWQRSGRVGRRGDAAIALVAQPDALDQYLVTHPQAFFARGFEHAVLDPHNPEVAGAHLPCAAAELPLRADEPWLAEDGARERLAALEERGALLQSDTGHEWFAARRRPHREVSLRQAGSSYAIVDDGAPGGGEPGRDLIGSVGAGNVFGECHEGAIYLHRGRQYHVRELDLEAREVRVRAVKVPYYTRALSEKETEILSRDRQRPAGNFRLVEGRVRVTTRIHAYERRRVHGQDLLATEPLDLPPSAFESTGVWLELPPEVPAALEAEGRHPMGGIHAVEHAALSLFPLFALCDRHDVAGISYTLHPQLGRPAIFLYDSHAGGMGIVSSLFDRIESLLETTLELIRDCPCEDGCPGCVHSPKCGSGNRPIDKAAAARVCELLLGRATLPALPRPPDPPAASVPVAAAPVAEAAEPRVVFFDIETRRSAQEVGGWHNAHLMRVAVAVLHDSATGRYEAFEEARVPELLERLRAADLVVGFNVLRFDYAVLRGYTDADPGELPTFDLLHDVHRRIGFRLPMGHLAEETLGIPKSADGLQSLAWWKAGEVQRVTDYCQRDVEILRGLFEHGARHGYLRFRTRDGQRVRLPARWNLAELVERARAEAAGTGERLRPGGYAGARDPRGRRASSSKSTRAVTGSADAIVTTTRSPSS